jgi:hypothetical protein
MQLGEYLIDVLYLIQSIWSVRCSKHKDLVIIMSYTL